jgi:hypothetical protein
VIDWLFRILFLLLVVGVVLMYVLVRNPNDWP